MPLVEPIPSLKIVIEGIRSGTITATGLFEICAANHTRCKQASIDPPLLTYKLWDPQKSLSEANAADQELASGANPDMLHGIPVSVKDIFGIKDWPTFAGTAQKLPSQWEEEGWLVQTLKKQRSVITGKTSPVEFAYGAMGTNGHWGTPRNPWDMTNHRICGGSTTGGAISLVEGSCLIAIGSDTGGSLRIPASYTGTVGLKTTKGRWPTSGVVPVSQSLDTVGLLTRTVADMAMAFCAVDPLVSEHSLKTPTPLKAASLEGMKVGICEDFFWDDCSPGIAETVMQAIKELEKANASLQIISFPEAPQSFELHKLGSLAAPELSEFLASELPDWIDKLDFDVTARLEAGKNLSAIEYLSRKRQYARLQSTAFERFQDIDVLVTPTIANTPPILSQLSDESFSKQANAMAVRNPGVVNGLGLCALTMPAGLDQAGMPTGLQLISPANNEVRLLEIALSFENVLGSAIDRLGECPLH